jgi:hypothetical protein
LAFPVPPASDLPEDFRVYDDSSTSEQLERSRLLAFEREKFDPNVDIVAIYRAIALPETVLERADLPLMSGERAYGTFLATQENKRTQLSQAGGHVSGNIGFTYGTESDQESTAAYLRVWLWRQSRWWLLFDVVTARF